MKKLRKEKGRRKMRNRKTTIIIRRQRWESWGRKRNRNEKENNDKKRKNKNENETTNKKNKENTQRIKTHVIMNFPYLTNH